jgi:hypothetical protein
MDDKRVTIDKELRHSVLDALVSTHDLNMLELVYLFTAFAISKDLHPLPPEKKEVISGDVFVEDDIYKLVAYLFKTDEPRRVAHELANAGMNFVKDKVAELQELREIFEFSDLES